MDVCGEDRSSGKDLNSHPFRYRLRLPTGLPDHFAREIRRKMDRLLDKLGIAFSIHFEDGRYGGLRIVLECIPFPETMKEIEKGLAEIIEPIPARPRKTGVSIKAPQRGRGGRARQSQRAI